MDLLRVYLLTGLVVHKVVWTALRGRAPREPLRPIKLLKIAALAGLVIQALAPELLPITAQPGAWQSAGVLVFTAGLLVAIAARVQLGKNWSDLESARILPGQSLIAGGLYRHVRHPIYLGDLLLVSGYELALNSWLVVLALPLAVFVWRKARREEALLEAGLPGYRDYLAQTGRFLPRHVAVGVSAIAVAFTIQLAIVHLDYQGNWTAFFYTGTLFQIPPSLAGEKIYIAPHSQGYDSQFYHYIAHAPVPGPRSRKHIDAPRLRYPRILLPGAAFLLALARQEWIDTSLLTVSLLSYFFGAYWLARYATLHGTSRWLGLALFLVPVSLISLDRITVDMPLAALCCGLVLYASEGNTRKCYVVVMLAALARETGVLLLGSYGLWLLCRRQWKNAALAATAGLPAAAWTFYVYRNTAPFVSHIAPVSEGNAFLVRLMVSLRYDLPPLAETVLRVLDHIALLGTALAVLLAAVAVFRRAREIETLAAMSFAALPIVLGGVIGYYEPFGYPRTLSPLLLLAGLGAIRERAWLPALPLAMVLPRVLIQLAPLVPWIRKLL